MKEKIKQLQSFFLVLMMLIMGTAGAWADTATSATAGTYSSTTNPGAAKKFIELSTNAVFTYRDNDKHGGISSSGIKATSDNMSGITFYISSPMTLSALITHTKSSEADKEITLYVKTVTTAWFQELVDGTSNSTVVSADPVLTDVGSKTQASGLEKSGTFTVSYGSTLPAGYYYVYAQSSGTNASSYMYMKSITLAASSGSTYTVTYHDDGKTSGTQPSDANTYYSGDQVTVLGAGTLVKTNYTLAGWNTASTIDGTHYNVGATFNISGDTNLYPVWKHKVDLSVNDADMGTISAKYGTGGDTYYSKAANDAFTSGDYVSYQTKLVLTATPNTGYHFDTTNGWGSGTTIKTNPSGDVVVEDNKEFIAHFLPNTYNIVFNANGGAGTMSDQAIDYGTTTALSSNTFTRGGYIFTGWNTESNGSGTSYTDGQSVSNLSSTDGDEIDLYAQWARVYTVTFDATTNEGTCSTASLTQASAGANIILPVATKEGSTFNGWFVASSGGSAVGAAGDNYGASLTSDITLYAQFSEASSTTKFSMARVGTSSVSMSAGTHALTSSEASFSGTGACSASAVATASATYLSNNYSGSFLFGTNSLAFKITLTQALAEGDIISFTGYGKELCFTTTSTRSTSISTTDYTYTIPSGSPLIGKTEFYVWRATSGNTYFNDFTIVTSGAVTSTYSVSFDLSSIADEIEGLTEQTALPNPLPTPTNVASGYTFERWYTDAAFTTAATAGAAINTNTTLYANFIMDTPTITPAAGDIYAKTTMTLSSEVLFTKAYGRWKTTNDLDSKATLTALTPMYNSTAIDSFNGFTTAETTGSQYFSYIISDGTFYSAPAVTSLYTVSHKLTITTQPVSAVYIKDVAATALSVEASDTKTGATISYKWKSSTDNSSWSDASGTNNTASYTPSTSTAETTYYKCVVSSNSGAASVESNVVTIEVNENTTFTVSFDQGIGSDTAVDAITQGSTGASITLPGVTLKNSDYEFAGWYNESGTLVGAASASYTPVGDITLYAKYNCKVTLSVGSGSGTVTAKNASTSATISSGSKVFEGTSITLTASPASLFNSWTAGTSGTTNPTTVTLDDVTTYTASFNVSEYEELFHTTFTTADGWAEGTENVLSGTTIISNEKTIDNTKVTFAGKSGTSYTLTVNTSTNQLTFGGSNLNASEGSTTPNCYMAIHLTGVNGSITVDFGNSSSQKWLYALDDGNTGAITTCKTQLSSKVTSFTIDNLQSTNVILYLGTKSTTLKEIAITTPKTRLVADSAQVRFIGVGSAVPVRISTNSPGALSIKTQPNSSIATVSDISGAKILTVTPVAVGETSVTLQVAQSGDYPAKELTIPIKVVAKTITIKTQPANLTCYQNESTEKKFTVAATVNTGNELTYQWYTCDDANKTNASAISGAIETSYVVNTTAKATVGTKYYFCRVTSATDNISLDTEVKTLTVTALAAGGTYNAVIYVGTKGYSVTYSNITAESVSSNTGSSYYSADLNTSTDVLTIGTSNANSVGSGVITLSDNTVINVTVKKHTIQLIWSADSKVYTNKSASDKGVELPLDNGSNDGLPTLTRLYEDGEAYEGEVDFYVDDTSIAYFGSTEGTNNFVAANPSSKPTIRYGGSQGGCKFYAYIASGDDAEDVKASYDLRVQQGYSNTIPNGRAVDVQQQYTMWDANTKLITVTYGGYKYNNHTWGGKTDSWGSATNYVDKDNAIDGYLYAVRNKERDAADEYLHAVNHLDDNNESAWYSTSEESPKGGNYAAYQRIKPFRLPCRASYLTFYAHKSGTLTAYVYQNGIVGNGGAENKLATGPRLGYWFDEEGWVQTPTATVVTKQKIANANARDKRAYGNYADMDAQLATWTNADDAIVVRKLRSKYCKSATNLTDNLDDYELDNVETHNGTTYPDLNPYYWGKSTDVTANNAAIMPMPERPIPHQGGHMIVNEGYVKYTIHVDAGKTYYFFGKMTKVGYAGMNFVEDASENRQTSRVDLATTDDWETLFGASGTALLNPATKSATIYDEITVPSNYRIGKWNTICLPFSVNENQLEEVFGKGTELAIYNGMEHDMVNHVYKLKYLRHVDQNILPGQPYMIYPTGRAVAERSNQDNGGMAETGETIATVSDVIGSNTTGAADGATRLTFKNVIINKGVTAKSYGSNVDKDGSTESYVFVGTDEPKSIVKYDLYYNVKTGEPSRWMKTNSGTLNTYHAFIQANTTEVKQDGITLTFSDDDIEKAWEPTAIDEEESGDPTNVIIIEDDGVAEYNSNVAPKYNGRSYNMMGQEVDATSAKGIIIVNGKKVMY